jgi:hypothetical protein
VCPKLISSPLWKAIPFFERFHFLKSAGKHLCV